MSDEMQSSAPNLRSLNDYRDRGGDVDVRGFAFTDIGNAKRFARDHGANVRFCDELGKQKFLVWTEEEAELLDLSPVATSGEADAPAAAAASSPRSAGVEERGLISLRGGYWCVDRTGEVMRLAKQSCARIEDEPQPAEARNVMCEGPPKCKCWKCERYKHFMATQERKALVSMIALGQSELPIPAVPEDFDRQPWLLNCINCTLDVSTGQVIARSAAREDMLTKRLPVRYDPNATCERWRSMLWRWMGGKEAEVIANEDERAQAIAKVESLISFLGRAVVMTLTGVINDRAVIFLYGRGRNGKTIFVETLRALMGGEFTSIMPIEALLAGKNQSSIPVDVADLRGKRLALGTETNENDRMSLAKLKRLSGGDALSGRQLYGQKMDFTPTHHLWIATNHKPNMRGADKAMFDRIKLVPFTVRIPDEEQIPTEELKAMLRAELSGILNWALSHLTDWVTGGLREPLAVREETNKWEREDDLLAHFLEELCERGPNHKESKGSMFSAWKNYCLDRHEFHGSATQFSKWMAEHEIEDGRTGKERFWKGIKLASSPVALPGEKAAAESRKKADDWDDNNPLF